jgi:hypothetical protein
MPTPDKQCGKAQMNFAENLENCWIFSHNQKTDGMKAQLYSDRFL